MTASRTVARQLMRLAPVRWYTRLVPREVIGFCYHVVADRPLPHVRRMYAFKSPAQFEADLLFLKRNFRVVSYPELLEARAAGRPVGPDAVFLSFDDGYSECFSAVRPLLLQHGLPCTFFVATGVLDNARMLHFNKVSLCMEALERLGPAAGEEALRALEGELGRPLRGYADFQAWVHSFDAGTHPALDGFCERLGVDVEGWLREHRPYLTRDEVRQLARDGFTIGGHTRWHLHLGSQSDGALVEAEIVESCREVAELTGSSEPVPFAFPYDADGVDRGFLRDLRRRHPFLGLFFGTRGLSLDADFLINRMISDAPPRWGRQGTNLPAYFRTTYLDELLAGAGAAR